MRRLLLTAATLGGLTAAMTTGGVVWTPASAAAATSNLVHDGLVAQPTQARPLLTEVDFYRNHHHWHHRHWQHDHWRYYD